MTLVELRDTLRKATGPDRRIDAHFALICAAPEGYVLSDVPGWICIPHREAREALPYTASIDAAVTLEVPGIQEVVVRKYPHGVYVRWIMHVTGEPGSGKIVVYGNDPDCLSPTEAIGRCLARVEYEIAKGSTA
jgi:hypothetical protein